MLRIESLVEKLFTYCNLQNVSSTNNCRTAVLIFAQCQEDVQSLHHLRRANTGLPWGGYLFGSIRAIRLMEIQLNQHISLAGASSCTWGYIREYFLNGTLPDNDTVCPVLGSLFPNPGASGLQEHEQKVFSAARRDMFNFEAFETVQSSARRSMTKFLL
jgi:hypothetical protein